MYTKEQIAEHKKQIRWELGKISMKRGTGSLKRYILIQPLHLNVQFGEIDFAYIKDFYKKFYNVRNENNLYLSYKSPRMMMIEEA